MRSRLTERIHSTVKDRQIAVPGPSTARNVTVRRHRPTKQLECGGDEVGEVGQYRPSPGSRPERRACPWLDIVPNEGKYEGPRRSVDVGTRIRIQLKRWVKDLPRLVEPDWLMLCEGASGASPITARKMVTTMEGEIVVISEMLQSLCHVQILYHISSTPDQTHLTTHPSTGCESPNSSASPAHPTSTRSNVKTP